MSYSRETVFQVWSDKEGYRWEITSDPDGLDCVEIRYVEYDGKITQRLTLPIEAARLLSECLVEYLGQL